MKINIVDWSCGDLLKETPWPHGSLVDGNPDDAFKIARELFDRGLNVMVRRHPSTNVGTKRRPVMTEETMMVAVDTQRFQQR